MHFCGKKGFPFSHSHSHSHFLSVIRNHCMIILDSQCGFTDEDDHEDDQTFCIAIHPFRASAAHHLCETLSQIHARKHTRPFLPSLSASFTNVEHLHTHRPHHILPQASRLATHRPHHILPQGRRPPPHTHIALSISISNSPNSHFLPLGRWNTIFRLGCIASSLHLRFA